jgi:hypothetical protein
MIHFLIVEEDYHIMNFCYTEAFTFLICKIHLCLCQCCCLLKFVPLIYVLRFKSDEERTPVHRIVEETFPHLLNIFNRLVQIVNPSLDVADLIKLICKIFWSSIYVSS